VPAARRSALFHAAFLEDLRFWIGTDRACALRVLDLIDAALREPFTGIGKPEPLRHQYAGCWSRRVTLEHRLVYRVTATAVEFLQARYHYR
jgi:toxin YoeB